MAIGIAVLGAGIFAREGGFDSITEALSPFWQANSDSSILATAEHVPAVQACSLLSLKAIYSRSPRSAKELASSAGVEAYFDSPATSSRSLDDLLTRSDIQAVIVALPILAQPDIIKKAITAGKHVLSEKPIAKDMKTANGLIQWYNGISTSTIWSVAENFRFLEVFVFGADRLKEIGGNVVTFSFKLFALIDRKDKFFQTQW
jgi:predicted dehydrogenase